MVRPFRINVAESQLADLRDRLARTRWPAQIGTGWTYGADTDFLKKLCAYWQNEYDWRLHEGELNRYPQFLASIDGLDAHFIHVKSELPGAQPLLLLHGWPGSFVEFIGLIDALSHPQVPSGAATVAFDLVIPSLPGFGFSGQPREPGWGTVRMAAFLDHLMRQVLGYSRYFVQGGDWGTIIGARMARNHATSVAALHINMPYALPAAGDVPPADWARFRSTGTGYLSLQSTAPDVIAVAQADSPAGLAAWILEKFARWSACGGNPCDAISADQLLTNILVYWVTNSAASAARIYFEAVNEGVPPFGPPRVEVPTGVAVFPAEPYRAPREWLERIYSIERWTQMPAGGHFAALEQPALLVDDIRAFFSRYRAL